MSLEQHIRLTQENTVCRFARANTDEMAATVAIDKNVDVVPAGRKLRLVNVSLRLHPMAAPDVLV